MTRSTRQSAKLITADSPGTSSQIDQDSQKEEKISQQSVSTPATQEEPGPEALVEEYRSSLEQETEEYEVVNQQLEQAIQSSCAQLEWRLALLEAELATLGADPVPENDPMLTVSELTSMELACWQIEDTVKQLREAEDREKERLLDEQERLQHEKTIAQEAQNLNIALTHQAAEAPVSPNLLVSRTRARMMHLQDQFRILQSGLIDYIDHLSVSLPQATSDLSLRSYFTRPPYDARDTPQRRSAEMRTVLEVSSQVLR
ncbi:hypothetical protein JCM5350_003605 [Sporobolomyces pararoseus]